MKHAASRPKHGQTGEMREGGLLSKPKSHLHPALVELSSRFEQGQWTICNIIPKAVKR